VLDDLEAQYQGRVEAIELGVHRSNQRALVLDPQAGFQTSKALEELGFLILQRKSIGTGGASACTALHLPAENALRSRFVPPPAHRGA